MISRLELNSRIQLCRQLAKREPANQALWMAEAGDWSRLSKKRLRAGPGILARLRAWSARSLSGPASAIVACMEHERYWPPPR
jgi:hypothetical protein